MKGPVRELGSWLVQRASAVYMLFFIVFLLVHFIVDPPHSYVGWRAWVTSPGVSVFTTVFFAALLAHAWIGLRVVMMDYVHPIAVRVGLLVLVGFGLIAMAAWVVRILFLRHG
jgi:succinate dehydrogenase / fumarate reductase membrane anchor subunit